jgi:hypothetical protein
MNVLKTLASIFFMYNLHVIILSKITMTPVCLGVRHPFRTCDQFSSFRKLFLDSYWFNDVGHLLWRAVGSVVLSWAYFIDSVFETWSQSYFVTDSQSVCLGIEHPCGTCDQILLPVGMLLSAICSVISQCSESRRTRNHTLLSHLSLPQPCQSQSHFTADSQSVSMSWRRAHFVGPHRKHCIFIVGVTRTA